MLIRIFPSRKNQLVLQNLCDKMGVPVLFGAGIPACEATLDGFCHDCEGELLGDYSDHLKWMVAYLDVANVGQARAVLVAFREHLRVEKQSA